MAGEVAIEVARQLAEPMRALRDRLGLVVDHLERHVATSTGPTPYPWRSLTDAAPGPRGARTSRPPSSRAGSRSSTARSTTIRRTGSISRAAVDLGLRLAGHHLGPGIELLFDLGNVPPARGTPGTLALLVAQLVAACARSARAVAGQLALACASSTDDGAGVVTIADNGDGSDKRAEARRARARGHRAVGRDRRRGVGGRAGLRVRARLPF